MNIFKIFRQTIIGLVAVMSFMANFAYAGAEVDAGVHKDQPYTGPSVEDYVALMDTDKNGFADVHEVRAFLESKHGKEYEREMLDRWETTSTSKSCGSSFSKSLYQ